MNLDGILVGPEVRPMYSKDRGDSSFEREINLYVSHTCASESFLRNVALYTVESTAFTKTKQN